MKEKIYLLLSASLAVFCIRESFSDADLTYDELSSVSSRSLAAPAELEPDLKGLISKANLSEILLDDAGSKSALRSLDFLVSDQENARRVGTFSLKEVVGFAEIARTSYAGHEDQEAMVNTMKKAGYNVKAFHKNTDTTEIGFAKGRHSGFVFMKGNEIIVSYRGTETNTFSNAFSDLSTDANGAMQKNPHGKGRIHKGFEKELNRSHEYLLTLIRTHCIENKINYMDLNIRVTGHSLGAGLATLFVDHLLNNLEFNPQQVSLITFASPRVGDKEFADSLAEKLKGRVLRVNIKNDLVTGICPVSGGYEHVGEALDLASHSGLITPHYMDSYIAHLSALTEGDFKPRDKQNSQTVVSYTDYVLGCALKALQAIDITAWDFWTHYDGFETNFAESKIAYKEAVKVLDPRLQDLKMVNEELADAVKRGEHPDTINLFKLQQVKAILAVIQVMQALEEDKFLARSLTKDQKGTVVKIKEVFQIFEKQVAKVMEAVQAVDELVNLAEESLQDIKRLQTLQVQASSAYHQAILNKVLARAEKAYKTTQEKLEAARASLEKKITKMDGSKEELIKSMAAIAKK